MSETKVNDIKKKSSSITKLTKIVLLSESVHTQLGHLKIDLGMNSNNKVIEKLIRDAGLWNSKYDIKKELELKTRVSNNKNQSENNNGN